MICLSRKVRDFISKYLLILILLIPLVVVLSSCNSKKHIDLSKPFSNESLNLNTSKVSNSPVTKNTINPDTIMENTLIPKQSSYVYKESKEYKTLINLKTSGLQIAQKDGAFFETSPELAQKILKILKSYGENSVYSPNYEGVSPINRNNYLYILRFKGLNDIKILTNYKFIFVGQNDNFYDDYTNGLLEYAMNNLEKIQNGQKYMYFEANGKKQPISYNKSEKPVESIRDDINGDGKTETIEVFFNGELSLWIDSKRYLFDCDSTLYFVNMREREVVAKKNMVTSIDIVPEKNSNEKLIVVSFDHIGANNFHKEIYKMKYSKDCKFRYFKISTI